MTIIDIKKSLQEFNKRFNIIENSSYQEEFVKFKIRVLNIFSDIDSAFTNEGINSFCQILGIKEEWDDHYLYGRKSTNIIYTLSKENNEKKFYYLLQVIFLLNNKTNYSIEKYFIKLSEAIILSSINLAMTKEKGQIIFYPKGEQTLDKTLVNEVLSFLNPESHKHFVEALTLYLNYSIKNAIKSSESIRRSLEEFLRYKLKNQKGLKENIDELQKKLKSEKSDTCLRNIIFQTFTYLDKYFNENSKHKDGEIEESENEFLVYQSGLLMRYIHKFKS